MGFFITIEGIEGAGKSTQMALLKEYLEKRGKKVLALREPGGTLVGEKLRAILLNTHEGETIDPLTELFLYEACRVALVRNVIKPALDAGKTVICDRFTDSTIAYQGFGRGIDIKAIETLNSLASAGVVPDITLLLDIAPEQGLKRAFKRINAKAGLDDKHVEALEKQYDRDFGLKEDRFEKEPLEFHKKVRVGFLQMAEKEPERFKVIDGSLPADEIHGKIRGVMERLMKEYKNLPEKK